MTETTNKIQRGLGRVAFLARRDDFQKLLDAGHPLKSMYEQYKDELKIGYPQFTKYVNRYIGNAKHDGHQRSNKSTQESQPTHGGSTSTIQNTNSQRNEKKSNFEHNPSSGNDRDDLI